MVLLLLVSALIFISILTRFLESIAESFLKVKYPVSESNDLLFFKLRIDILYK